jgi:uncharacterized Zn finger protein
MPTPKLTPKLTEAVIRASASTQSFQRGQELFQNFAISNTAIQGSTISGECEGTSAPFYQVRVELDGGGIRAATCSCPYNFDGQCKHVVALLLAYAHEPEAFVVRQEAAELLAALSHEQLQTIVTKLLSERPELYDWFAAAMAVPTPGGKGQKKAAKRKKVDVSVYRRQVKSIIQGGHNSRSSYSYRGGGDVTGELGGVENTAMEFLKAGDAETALEILKVLLDESHDGFEYMDDSDGELGEYLSGLGETMAEVILSLDLDENQREDLVSDLDEINDKLNDYGVDGLEVAMAAAQYGWGEMPYDQAVSVASADEEDDDDEYDEGEEADDWDEDEEDESGVAIIGARSSWSPETVQQKLTRAKLNVLERQGRTEEFLALCLRADAPLRYALKLCELNRVPEAVTHALKHLQTTDDALKLGQQLRELNHLDDAVKVGERGLQLDGYKLALGSWLGPIEEAQGRSAQALTAWQAAFHSSPSLETYQAIKRLAGAKWSKLKPTLIAALEKGWNHKPLAEILLFEQDWDAAIKVADGKNVYYDVVRIVADALIPHRPEWVIQACIKQSDALIAKTQSKYYGHAAEWLKNVRAAYLQLGRKAEWETYLANLKEQYRRRPALQDHLRRL